MGIVLSVVVLVLTLCAFASIGLVGVIAMLVGGAIGFAIGSMAGGGWAVFGALLGGLVGVAILLESRKKKPNA